MVAHRSRGDRRQRLASCLSTTPARGDVMTLVKHTLHPHNAHGSAPIRVGNRSASRLASVDERPSR